MQHLRDGLIGKCYINENISNPKSLKDATLIAPVKSPVAAAPFFHRYKVLMLLAWSIGHLGFALLFVAFIWSSQQSARDATDIETWKLHLRDVLIESAHSRSALQDTETGQRGYLITQRDDYLQRYSVSLAALKTSLDKLSYHTRDNTAQQTQIGRLHEVIEADLSLLESTITLVNEGETQAAVAIVATDRGKVLMDQAYAILKSIDVEERVLLDARQVESEIKSRHRQDSIYILVVLGVVIFLTGVGAINYVFRLSGKLRVAAAVAVAEERFRGIVTTSLDAIISSSPDDVVQTWNAAAERIYGWSAEEAIGRSLKDLIVPEDKQSELTSIEGELNAGQIVHLTTARLHKNGRRIDAEVSLAPLFERGMLVAVCSIERDVTEQQRSDEMRRGLEAELRESEARFRMLFEAAPMAVAIVDPDTLNFTFFSDLACDMLGYERNEFGRLSVNDIAGILSVDGVWTPSTMPALSKTPLEFERQHRCRDGTMRTVLFRAQLIPASGRLLVYAAWIDITHSRAQDEQLRLSLERQTAILGALPAHVALLDADGNIVQFNEAWRRFELAGGRHPNQAACVDTNYMAACSPAAAAGDATALEILQGLRALFVGKRERIDLVYPCIAPDGTKHWFHFVAVPDTVGRTSGTRASGAVILHLDVTEQTQAKLALQEREALQRIFIERAPVGIAVFDTNMRYLIASRRYFTQFGLPDQTAEPATLIGRSHYDFFPLTTDRWREGHRRVLIDGETLSNELQAFPRADGGIDWVRCEMTPWRYHDGTIGGAVLFSEVVTDRVEAEAALQASERRSQLAITAADLGTWEMGLNTDRPNLRSLRHDQIFGYKEKQSVWSVAIAEMHVLPEDIAAFRVGIETSMQAGLMSFEFRVRWPDGSVHWIEAQGRTYFDDSGQPTYMAGVVGDITARKEADAALVASESRLRLAVQAAELGTWDRDMVTNESIWNETAQRILGSRPPAGADNTRIWREFVHPKDINLVAAAYQAALLGSTPFQCEFRIVRPDGGFRWLRPLGRFIRTLEGAPVRFVGVFSDITQIKQDTEWQTRLLQLLDASNDYISTADAKGRQLYINAGGRKAIGLGEHESITGLRAGDFVSKNTLDALQFTVFPTAIAQGRWDGETQVINRATGAVIDFQRSTFPLYDHDRLLTGFGTIMRDMTAAKQTQRTLADNEALLRSILATVPSAMVLIDEHGMMQSFSMTAEQLFGWTAHEAIGQNVSMLMPAPYREQHSNYLSHYFETGERRMMGIGRLVAGQRKDGSTFPMELSVGEIIVAGRRRFTGFVRDLTEQTAATVRLQQLQQELAQFSRLHAAEAMASALAHELNQPLTAATSAVRAAQRILASAQLVNAPEALSRALNLAAEQALRAGQIVQRLREFVARGGEADKRLESVQTLVEEAGALALVGIEETGIHTIFRIAPDLPLVMADRVQIQQVLVNLIRNAIQAMTADDANEDIGTARRRKLSVTACLKDVEMVEIAVADTGTGLSSDVMARLFEPFTTTKLDGMGVGLSISRPIIEAHGGQLWAEANPGGGAVFRFTLEAALNDLVQPAEAVA